MRRFLSVLGLWLSLRLNGIWNLCLTIISCTHLSDFTPLILSPGFSFCFIWHYMLFCLWEDSRVFMARGQPQTQQKFLNLRLTIIPKFYFLIPPIITTGFLVYYLFQYCFGVHLKRTPRVFLGILLIIPSDSTIQALTSAHLHSHGMNFAPEMLQTNVYQPIPNPHYPC